MDDSSWSDMSHDNLCSRAKEGIGVVCLWKKHALTAKAKKDFFSLCRTYTTPHHEHSYNQSCSSCTKEPVQRSETQDRSTHSHLLGSWCRWFLVRAIEIDADQTSFRDPTCLYSRNISRYDPLFRAILCLQVVLISLFRS